MPNIQSIDILWLFCEIVTCLDECLRAFNTIKLFWWNWLSRKYTNCIEMYHRIAAWWPCVLRLTVRKIHCWCIISIETDIFEYEGMCFTQYRIVLITHEKSWVAFYLMLLSLWSERYLNEAMYWRLWQTERFRSGGSESSKIGVGGDSAGGRISSSIAHDVQVDFQVSFVP